MQDGSVPFRGGQRAKDCLQGPAAGRDAGVGLGRASASPESLILLWRWTEVWFCAVASSAQTHCMAAFEEVYAGSLGSPYWKPKVLFLLISERQRLRMFLPVPEGIFLLALVSLGSA